jgi:glycolate oxidase FAD binding subunit
LTAVTFKVLPAPETEETVRIAVNDDATAMRIMSDALQSSAEISAAAHIPGEGTYLRFEGIGISVAARRDRFVSALRHGCEIINETASRAIWTRIRDCKVLPHDASRALWRISVAPMCGAEVAANIATKTDARHAFDWGGGLLWMSVPAAGDGGAALIRSSFSHGHAMLFAAPEDLRQRVDVFQPQSSTLAALTKRVKTALDPEGKLNPGRMFVGI